MPVLFRANACTGDFEKAIWTIVTTDFDGNTAIAPDSITFLAEEQAMKRVETSRGRHVGGRRRLE